MSNRKFKVGDKVKILELVYETPVKTQTNTNELTQRDLQVLSTMLKWMIYHYEHNIVCTKDQVEHYFERCDPEDVSTSSWFDSLNINKDALRYFRNRKNKLAEIQRKIKRKIANG